MRCEGKSWIFSSLSALLWRECTLFAAEQEFLDHGAKDAQQLACARKMIIRTDTNEMQAAKKEIAQVLRLADILTVLAPTLSSCKTL